MRALAAQLDPVLRYVKHRGDIEELPPLHKAEVAAQLFDRIEKLRGGRQ